MNDERITYYSLSKNALFPSDTGAIQLENAKASYLRSAWLTGYGTIAMQPLPCYMQLILQGNGVTSVFTDVANVNGSGFFSEGLFFKINNNYTWSGRKPLYVPVINWSVFGCHAGGIPDTIEWTFHLGIEYERG